MDGQQLWEIGSVPSLIMGLIPFLIYCYLAWKQSMANDDLIAELETSPAIAKTHNRKIWLAKALLRSCFWHWIGIPIVAFGLMVVRFGRARKDGISGPEPVLLTTPKF
jgi:hypothetical protein